MKYQEYIDLGFERTDITDSVEHSISGYNGYILSKEFAKNVFIEATSCDLDNPKLYIRKKNSHENHILPLTKEI